MSLEAPNLTEGIVNGGEAEMAVMFATPEGYTPQNPHLNSNPGIARFVSGLATAPNIGMLENGMRFYMDCGDHPEGSTAESTSFARTAAGLLAIPHMMDEVCSAVVEKQRMLDTLAVPEGMRPYRLHRRVVSQDLAAGKLESWGIHDNFSMTQEAFTRAKDSLATLAVTALPLTGAGMIKLIPRPTEPAFVLSERAWLIFGRTTSSQLNQSGKAIMMIRDEPLAGTGTIRIQMGMNDGNVLPLPIVTRYGVISWGIRLAEHGITNEDLELADPAAACKAIAADPSLRATVKLKNGQLKTALAVQKSYLERCKLAAQKGMPVSEEELIFLEQIWEPHVNLLLADPAKADTVTEWGIKQALINRAMHRTGHALNHPQTLKIDFDWSERHESSLGEKVRQRLWAASPMVTPELVSQARWQAPLGRAALRGQVIRAAAERDADVNVSWDKTNAQLKQGRIDVSWPDATVRQHKATQDLIQLIKAQPRAA